MFHSSSYHFAPPYTEGGSPTYCSGFPILSYIHSVPTIMEHPIPPDTIKKYRKFYK